jgi:hypothetical protein
MPILDWNSYRKQLVAGVGEIAKISPDTVRGYAMSEALQPRLITWARRPAS